MSDLFDILGRINEIESDLLRVESDVKRLEDRLDASLIESVFSSVEIIVNSSGKEPIMIDQSVIEKFSHSLSPIPGVNFLSLSREDILSNPNESAWILASLGLEESRRFGEAWKVGYESGQLLEEEWYSGTEAARSWFDNYLNTSEGLIGNINVMLFDGRVVGAGAVIGSNENQSVINEVKKSIEEYLPLDERAPERVRDEYNLNLRYLEALFYRYGILNECRYVNYAQLFVSSDLIISSITENGRADAIWSYLESISQNPEILLKLPEYMRNSILSVPIYSKLSLRDRQVYIYRMLSGMITVAPIAKISNDLNSNGINLPISLIMWTQTEIPGNKMSEILSQFIELKKATDPNSSSMITRAAINTALRFYLRSFNIFPRNLRVRLEKFSKKVEEIVRIDMINPKDNNFLGKTSSGKTEILATVIGLNELINIVSDTKVLTALISMKKRYWDIMVKGDMLIEG